MIEPNVLLSAYARGVFPMADYRDAPDVKWYTSRRRGIIPIDNFRVSSNVRRLIRNHRYDIAFDSSFREVIEGCANRESSWISNEIIESYVRLHRLGYAHSVDIFNWEGELVGGQYGVSLGAAFFGESMFEQAKEASKIALYYCHKALVQGGYELWDTQFWSEHLAQFGCIEISAAEYQERLQQAIQKEATFESVDTEI